LLIRWLTKVFAVLWHEPTGSKGSEDSELDNPVAVRGRFGEQVYSHIRRMVVVKPAHGHCWCLSVQSAGHCPYTHLSQWKLIISNRPINTYKGQGVTRPGFSQEDKSAHCIIYMTDTRPYCLPEEEKYLAAKKPIAVERASGDQKLDPMSRLNFRKVYTIEHNVKAMAVGQVTKDSLPLLMGYWQTSLE
jgi:hypothetical protein